MIRLPIPVLPALCAAPAMLAAVASAQSDSTPVDCNLPEPIPLCYGEHADCEINPLLDTDTFRFLGVVGDDVRIVIRSWTSMDPRLEVRDPFGATILPVVQCDGACTIEHNLTLPMSGSYTLIVTDWFLDQTGPYTLTVERIPPPYVVPALLYNGSMAVTLEYLGDIDFVEFEGNAGDQVTFDVNSATSLDPWVDVYGPSGYLTSKWCDGGCSLSIPLSLTETGTYRALIHDWFYDQTGSFTVGLNCVFSPSPTGMCAAPAATGPIGTSFCMANPNSTGNPASISAAGSPFVADDNLRLRVSGVPRSKLGLYIMSPNPAQVPFPPPSQGISCVGAGAKRFSPQLSCFNEEMQLLPGFASYPTNLIQPGQTWYFSAWFRDANPGPTSNASDGVMITFL